MSDAPWGLGCEHTQDIDVAEGAGDLGPQCGHRCPVRYIELDVSEFAALFEARCLVRVNTGLLDGIKGVFAAGEEQDVGSRLDD